MDAVEFLARAAVSAAYRQFAEALAPGHADRVPAAPLTTSEAAVRLTAEADDIRLSARLSAASGRNRAYMEQAVLAWGFGGATALATLEDNWTPDRTTLTRARAALATAWADEEAPVRHRVRARWTETGTGRQLRRPCQWRLVGCGA